MQSLLRPIAALVLLASAPAVAAERPNFVVLIADDLAWDDLGCYGHPAIRTPHIDRLAGEGLRFDRAFLTASSCSPSRSSILTGRYPHATGAAELHLPLPAGQIMLTETLRADGYYTAAAGKWHLGEPAKAKIDRYYEPGDASGSGNWLRAIRECPPGRPFFLWLAAFDPHRPYEPGAIDEPHDRDDARIPPFLPDTPAVRDDFTLYYDEIARFDAHVGEVVAELDERGLGENTVVFVMSDNGRPFPRCKNTCYDDGIRTPLIVRWPAGVGAGGATDSLVSSIDLAPTVLTLAGLEVGPTYQGRDFSAVLGDPSEPLREYVFAEHNWHDFRAYERAVRGPRFLYIRNWVPELPGTPPADAVRSPAFEEMQRRAGSGGGLTIFSTPRPEEELYDLEADPFALENLAGEADHAEKLAELRIAMTTWRQETRDSVPDPLTEDGFDRASGERLPGVGTPHPSFD